MALTGERSKLPIINESGKPGSSCAKQIPLMTRQNRRVILFILLSLEILFCKIAEPGGYLPTPTQ
jgi:hypothetical protein